MGYPISVGERNVDSPYAGVYDAPWYINSEYTLAPGLFNSAYGALTKFRDRDTYAIGTLPPGNYKVTVQGRNWDQANQIDALNYPYFEILNSVGFNIGGTPQRYTEFSLARSFRVFNFGDYYVSVIGDDVAYMGEYEIKIEGNFEDRGSGANIPAVGVVSITISDEGDFFNGEYIASASLLYDDDNGIVDAKLSFHWYAQDPVSAVWYPIPGERGLTCVLSHREYGRRLGFVADFIDDAGYFEMIEGVSETLAPTGAPKIYAYSPINKEENISPDTNIVITFTESVRRGSGYINLKKIDGTLLEVYDQTSLCVEISGITLTTNPENELPYGTQIEVEFAADAVQDLMGNSYDDGFVYSFRTQFKIPKFWKDTSKITSETNKAGAVNLTDAISILKMIVGLSVNSNNAPLSPYQAVAADFDQNGSVDLGDAIGVLKMVVGLNAPAPTWKYFDDAKLASTYNATQALIHKSWSAGAAIEVSSTADPKVKLVGVLTGDVDGSWVS